MPRRLTKTGQQITYNGVRRPPRQMAEKPFKMPPQVKEAGADAVRYWKETAEILRSDGRLFEDCISSFATTCCMYAEMMHLERVYRENGTPAAYTMLWKARNAFLLYCREFGLTPQSERRMPRTKLNNGSEKSEEKQPENPLAKFGVAG